MPKKRTSGRRSPIRRIGISTGGGDAPGLNAVIRAVALSAHNHGWEAVGIRDGYNGIFLPDQYPDGGLIPLTPERVRGITHLGGTIIGTTNAGNPLKYPVRQRDGKLVEVDRSDELVKGLAAAGDRRRGRGGRRRLARRSRTPSRKKGVRIVGVPKTIDNDLSRTVDHLRLRHRGVLRDRVHRPAALDGRLAPPRDGGRGDGPLRRAGSRSTPASRRPPT